ncbi:adenylate/guanylate cyclase domain-containing protein [uncultured Caulobacter sp.]|uniref:adenylate/guanylate cyclase domain-containing protein n=1 Tax=uncultured Caulobacter sp. TaxID=158749 RepID=UPI00262AD361|nr:adenylate/guanylate cyclase domain-containing protein [uncultured Caulobacter sp.]
MAKIWKEDRARDHLKKKIKDVETVTVVNYTRETSLENIPTNKAYRVDGVHLYADIVNLDDMLAVTKEEGEMCHKRTLRFLNLHYRAAHRAIVGADAKRVDFHNQRLHALIAKPYDSEAKRVHRAVALAQLMIDVLAQTGDSDQHIPDAKLRVGIDTGKALAVNNGRSGYREPLFLGAPANHAAKLSGAGAATGIYLTNEARKAIGLDEVDTPKTTRLTKDEIKASQDAAALEVTAESIVEDWRKDLADNPIGSFEFSRPTPPLKNLDIPVLTPGNSKRFEGVSTYADLDNFTQYVADNIDDNAEDVVRVLHVLRAEMDRVLTSDFEGAKIRFIGDCLHGMSLEGTAKTTDDEESVSTAVLCAGALRSSFDLAIEMLDKEGIDASSLGLQIGLDFGPMTITRLGLKGDRVRCAVSRGVRSAEAEQCRCGDRETAIGQAAYDAGSRAVRDLFGTSRKMADLDYDTAVDALAESGDEVAKAARSAGFAVASPAVAKAAETVVKPYVRLI